MSDRDERQACPPVAPPGLRRSASSAITFIPGRTWLAPVLLVGWCDAWSFPFLAEHGWLPFCWWVGVTRGHLHPWPNIALSRSAGGLVSCGHFHCWPNTGCP